MPNQNSLPGVDRRIEAIRLKFVASLPGSLAAATGSLTRSLDGDPQAAQAVATAYEAIHGICGLAGTLGHHEIGNAAKAVDRCLVRAFREKRGLEPSMQTVALKELEALKNLVFRTFEDPKKI